MSKSVLLLLSIMYFSWVSAQPEEAASLNRAEASALFYSTLNDLNLPPEQQRLNLELVLQHAEASPQSPLQQLVVYQLAIFHAKERNFELSHHYLSRLGAEAEADGPDTQVLEFLKNKVNLELMYRQSEYEKLQPLADSLIQQANRMNVKAQPFSFDTEVSITQLDVAEVHNILGVSHYMVGNYELAQQNFLTALNQYQSIEVLHKVAPTLSNLSMISWAQDDFEKALEYLEKAILIAQQTNNTRSYLTNLLNKGIYLRELGKHQESVATFESLLADENIGLFPRIETHVSISLGNVFLENNQWEKSRILAEKGLEMARKTRNEQYIARANVLLGQLALVNKNYSNAEKLLNDALAYYQDKKFKREEADIYQVLSKLAEARNNHQKALAHFIQYHSKVTDLQNESRKQSIAKLQEKFNAKQREQEIAALTSSNTLQKQQLETEKLNRYVSLLVFASALCIIVFGLIFYYQRKVSKRLIRHNFEIQAREKVLTMYSMAFKNSSDAVWICDKHFNIEVVNEAYCKVTRRDANDIVGEKIRFAPVHGQDEHMAERLFKLADENGRWQGEVYDKKANGTVFPLDLKIEVIKNSDGEVEHYLGVFRNIAEKRRVQEQLLKLATHDDLTGLPNRALLSELIGVAFKNAERNKEAPALLFLDLDGFKKINDSFGHQVGDEIIQKVAQRIIVTLRKKDIVSRVGGDEFCVLVELKDPQLGAAIVAKKLLKAFQEPFSINAGVFKLTTSIGIALYPEDATEPQELLRKSDIAMYDAKNEGKNGYRFFEDRMNSHVSSQLAREQQIAQAINQNQFIFYYQPFINISTGKIAGGEALIRWKKPDGKIVFPDEFISFAEKAGLIEQIDHIVIDQVFAQVAHWKQQSQLDCGVISLNLSAKIFSQSNKLISLLSKSLQKHQVNACDFKIEITEGMLLRNIEQAISTMADLKAMGFMLAVDDFGTGFSSLNYLKRFPIDILKIDRTFIMDMHRSKVDRNIVRSIIDLAHNLELSVVAEGVELEEHLDILKKYQCEEFQGYLFSRPVVVEAFEKLLADHSKDL
ncbi:EAL domain-containing protein [Aliikangiella sp. IMCC44632]